MRECRARVCMGQELGLAALVLSSGWGQVGGSTLYGTVYPCTAPPCLNLTPSCALPALTPSCALPALTLSHRWCGKCRQIGPFLDTLVDKYPGVVRQRRRLTGGGWWGWCGRGEAGEGKGWCGWAGGVRQFGRCWGGGRGEAGEGRASGQNAGMGRMVRVAAGKGEDGPRLRPAQGWPAHAAACMLLPRPSPTTCTCPASTPPPATQTHMPYTHTHTHIHAHTQTFAKFDTTAPELEVAAGELGIKALPAFRFFKVGRACLSVASHLCNRRRRHVLRTTLRSCLPSVDLYWGLSSPTRRA